MTKLTPLPPHTLCTLQSLNTSHGHFPRTTGVLQERLYGVPLTDLEGIQKVSKNPEATLISALNTWTLSVMNCDFFHAVSFSRSVTCCSLVVVRGGLVFGAIHEQTGTL